MVRVHNQKIELERDMATMGVRIRIEGYISESDTEALMAIHRAMLDTGAQPEVVVLASDPKRPGATPPRPAVDPRKAYTDIEVMARDPEHELKLAKRPRMGSLRIDADGYIKGFGAPGLRLGDGSFTFDDGTVTIKNAHLTSEDARAAAAAKLAALTSHHSIHSIISPTTGPAHDRPEASEGIDTW